jgi:hypothetical protein
MDRGAILKEVTTGGEPEGVLVSEDGKTVYVTSEAGDLVHEVDTACGAITRDVVVGLRPRRFAATPDNKDLWVTAELSGATYIVDRAKFVVTGNVPFLPPSMRKSDVTPVGIAMRARQDRLRGARARRACRRRRRGGAQGSRLHPRRQAPGASRCHATARAER